MKDQFIKKINILVIISEVEGYGAGRSMLDSVLSVRKYNINPYILVRKDGLLIEYLKENELPYLVTDFKMWLKGYKWLGGAFIKRHIKDLYNIIKTFWIVFKLRKQKFDIVHTGDLCTDIGIKLSKILQTKHIIHIRALLKEQFGMEFEKGEAKSFEYINKNSCFVICNSWEAYNKYKIYVDPKKIKMVYNGIYSINTVNKNSYKNSGPLKLLMIGRYEEGKGQMVALKSLKILKNKGYQLTLDFYGDGPFKEIIHAFRTENKLEEFVNIHEFDKDIFYKIQNYDAGLMCSKIEGPARVLVEYMINGLPVIASAAGAMLELIQEDFNGYLFPPGNHDDLASKIENLLLNPKKISELGKNAFDSLSDKFSTEKNSAELVSLYHSCLNLN